MTRDQMAELAARVRADTPIESVVRASGFELVGHGKYLRGRLHDSLVVNREKGFYFWNSRGESGDIFTWLEKREGARFVDILDRLAGGLAPAERRIVPSVAASAPPALLPPPPPPPLPQDLHLRCHEALDEAGRWWWQQQGITEAAQDVFLLGVCDDHPCYPGRNYTIPVLEHGRLVNLQLRLGNPAKPGDKYRPYRPGYGSQLFNADAIRPNSSTVLVTAGEKKAIVLWSAGFTAVSPTNGCSGWQDAWTALLAHVPRILIVFDPHETEPAEKLARRLGPRALVVDLPDKPDDFLLRNGKAAFTGRLRWARKVKP